MAFADRGRAAGPLPAAVAPALGNGTIAGDDVPCPVRWPDTARLPAAATKPRRIRGGYATIPRKRMRGRKPCLASFQEANPRTAPTGTCRRGEEQSCWTMTKGAPTPKVKSRQRSPTPLRDALTARLLFANLRSSLITRPTLFHPFLWPPSPLAPISPRFLLRGLAPLSRELAPSFAATDILASVPASRPQKAALAIRQLVLRLFPVPKLSQTAAPGHPAQGPQTARRRGSSRPAAPAGPTTTPTTPPTVEPTSAITAPRLLPPALRRRPVLPASSSTISPRPSEDEEHHDCSSTRSVVGDWAGTKQA